MAVTGSITITQNSQDIANNTSTITVVGKATMSGPSMDYNDRTGTLTIDGTKYSFTTNFPENSTKQLFSKKVTIKHGTDGKKKVSASFTITTGMTGTLDGGVLSASTSKTLTTIPRKSTVTCADGNIGSSTTININRASSSFTHTLTYSFLGLTGTIVIKTNEPSKGWDIPTSFYAKIPNAKSGKGTITCETFSGNTSLGTTTCTFNAFVANSNPTVSATIEDVNSTTVALTGDKNKLVKYFSNAKVDITATPKNSATISSRKVVCGNKSGTAISNTLNGVESGNFVVSCVDSRGYSASKPLEKTLINYIKLAFTKISLGRPSTTSNTINYEIKGNYFNNTFGQVANTLSLKYRYRQSGGTWSDYTSIAPNTSENVFSHSGTFGDIFDFNNAYEFQFVLEDKLMNVPKTVTVSRGTPIIDVGKNDVTVNELLRVRGELETLSVPELLTLFKCYPISTANLNLNDFKNTGFYYFSANYTPVNIPIGVNGWLQVIKAGNDDRFVKQIWYRHGTANSNDKGTFIRTCIGGAWSDWQPIAHYAVGDVIVTSTNTNPSTRFGGTWQLIDKEFKSTESVASGFTVNSTNVSASSFRWARQGHTITLELSFTNKIDLSDSTIELGTIVLNTLGISRFTNTHRVVGFSDGGNCAIFFNVSTSGVVTTVDIIPESSMASNTIYVTVTTSNHYSHMLDSACDKFYWKRTA